MKIILLLASIVTGFVIWFGLSKYEASLEQRYLSQQPEAPTASVFVYADDFNFGDFISDGMIVAQDRLLTSLPDDFVSHTAATRDEIIGQFIGKNLARDVRKFELLRNKDFLLRPNRTLSASLEPDARAVAIKVSEEKIAGGFVLPGDRIDLIATISKDFDGDGKASAKSFTFLKNVKVLAIGQDASIGIKPTTGISLPGGPTENATETRLGSTITLQLSSNQAEVLSAASQVAKLSVALRRQSDETGSELGDVAFLESDGSTPIYDTGRQNTAKDTASKEVKKLTVQKGEKVRVFSFD